MKRRVIKPLREVRTSKRRKPKPRKPGNPREEWVREQIEGYVFRRFVPESERYRYQPGYLSASGWWESSPSDLAHARLLAANIRSRVPEYHGYMVYAFRVDPDTKERHLALIPNEELENVKCMTPTTT